MITGAHRLDGRRIVIVAMTSWGEAGNWLSAKSLEAAISRAVPRSDVSVLAADQLVPAFARAGRAIKAATLDSRRPEERKDRYAAVLHALGDQFPRGSEDHPSGALARDLRPAADWLSATRPDLLIGTKGIICRALLGAARLAEIRVPVVNYVTNHGHFTFEVHHCPGAAVHLVRIPEAKQFLESTCGYDPATVRVIGYLVAAQRLMGGVPAPEASARASLIVVSNRGGEEYLDLLRHLGSQAADLGLTFVALHDERQRNAARAILESVGAGSWQVVTELNQDRLFGLMRQAQASAMCALVCKASPNSIFEAAYFRLPMFLLRTGLPMEDWGADLVVREGLGVVSDDMGVLTVELLEHLRDPRKMAGIRTRLDAFWRRQIDQQESIELVAEALGGTLASAGEAFHVDR